MTLMSWKPEYSVGIESVDHEHQEMIDLINAIYVEMSQRHDMDSIEQFLGDVHAAISAHFALEENAMQKSAYVEYAEHKQDHEELLEQIRDMMDRVHSDPERAIWMLQQRLSDWFAAHFATFDARLHGNLHLPKRGPAAK